MSNDEAGPVFRNTVPLSDSRRQAALMSPPPTGSGSSPLPDWIPALASADLMGFQSGTALPGQLKIQADDEVMFI